METGKSEWEGQKFLVELRMKNKEQYDLFMANFKEVGKDTIRIIKELQQDR
jgi:hypothetical protein